MNSVVSTTSSVVVVVEVSDVVVLDDSVVWGWSAGTSEEPSPPPELPNTQMTNATMPTTTAAPMTAGNFQLLAQAPWLLTPARNPAFIAFVSHKALRLTMPLLLGALLVSNVMLLDWWPYQVAMAGQAAFYAAALGGCVHREASGPGVFLKLPFTMCLLSWATVLGFIRFVTDHQQVTWDRIRSSSDVRSRP